LEDDGRPVGQGQTATHIVASGGKSGHWENAAKSRDILDLYDISVDDAANGIPLGHPNPHGQTHTREFHTRVYERLLEVLDESKDQGKDFDGIRNALLSKLRYIGNQVLGGNYIV
jgi:hypothetical protein